MEMKKALKANTTLILSQLLLLLLVLLAGDTQGEITCTAVTTRINTEVTCDFGLDINKTKHNFNVEFYYPDFKARPETPVACNFLPDSSLICREGSDVTFNRHVSDQIRFTSSPAVDKVGGQYICHLVPSLDNTPVQPCPLTFKEIPTTTQPPPPPPLTTTPPTTGSSKPVPHANDGLQSSVNKIMALMVVVVTLLTAIVLGCIIILAILYRRRRKLKKWWKGSTKHIGLDASRAQEKMTALDSPLNSTGHCTVATMIPELEPVSEVTKDEDEARNEEKMSSVWKRLKRSIRGQGSVRREADTDENGTVTTPEAPPECDEEAIALRPKPEPLNPREESLSHLPLVSHYPVLTRTASATAADYNVSRPAGYGGYGHRPAGYGRYPWRY